jgi:hypothetical protein
VSGKRGRPPNSNFDIKRHSWACWAVNALTVRCGMSRGEALQKGAQLLAGCVSFKGTYSQHPGRHRPITGGSLERLFDRVHTHERNVERTIRGVVHVVPKVAHPIYATLDVPVGLGGPPDVAESTAIQMLKMLQDPDFEPPQERWRPLRGPTITMRLRVEGFDPEAARAAAEAGTWMSP